MRLYGKFLAGQQARAQRGRLAEALRSFDESRTVTLYNLLCNPSLVRKIKAGNWLDVARLERHIRAYCDFMHLVRRDIKYDEALVFFQATSPGEEERFFKVRKSDSDHSCWEEAYFLTHMRPTASTDGSWSRETRQVKPGTVFINEGAKGIVQDPKSAPGVRSGSMIGYRVPNYAHMLGVSRTTATDYFARIIIHDLGHSALPRVAAGREMLHDVAMVRAMNLPAPSSKALDFEHLVRIECCDPYAFLYLGEIVGNMSTKGFSPVQRAFHAALVQKYSHKALEAAGPLWGLTRLSEEGDDLRDLRTHVDARIEHLQHTGFAEYQLAA